MLVACGEVTREDDIGPGDSGVKDIAQVESKPKVDAPAPDQPLVMDTGIDQPVADQMAADQPIQDQPIPDQPIPDQPIPDQLIPDQPIPDAPMPDMPILDFPVPDLPIPDQGGVVPATWVTIKAGSFLMGSPDGTGAQPKELCRKSDETQHQVTLTNNFEIQSTEVTQDQFFWVMGYKPSHFSTCGGTCPVEQVNWYEAAAYCNELSKKKGLTACYTCTGSGSTITCQESSAYSGQKMYTCPGYRLPAEAEWEYAYRAGTTTAFYNGGITNCTIDPNADKIGWHKGNSSSTTHPVGQKTANAWGLFDMAGNVWEWCHDLGLFNYGTSAVTDPWGSTSGFNRVTQGGSWYDDPKYMRAAGRSTFTATNKYNHIGFRCARTVFADPIAHWRLDEGSGTAAKDSSGNNYTGTVSSATWTVGIIGKALSFTGNGKMTTLLTPTYGPNDSFSYVAWFRTTNTGNAMSLFGFEASKTSEVQVGIDTGGIARFNINDGSKGGDAKSSLTFADGQWHMMAAVRDGVTKKLLIYVDGVQVASSTDNSTASINQASKLSVSIGAVNQGTKHEKPWQGEIDEPRIYSAALSAGQIKLLYTSIPLKSGLAAYYDFDASAQDAVGTNHGVVKNAVKSSSGKIAGAYSFNGSTAYIELTNNAIFDMTSDATYSIFFKPTSTPSTEYMLLAKHLGGSKTAGWFLSMNNQYKANVQIYSSLHHVLSNTNKAQANQWNHVAITYSSATQKLKIYVNGKLDKDENFPTKDLPTKLSLKMRIGAMEQSGPTPGRPFKGLIDEVGVWTRALAALEIQSLHNNGKGLNPITLVSGK